MAKWPYNAAGSITLNPNGSLHVSVTVKNGNGVVQLSTGYDLPPETPAWDVVFLIKQDIRRRVGPQFELSDLPATFSLSFGVADLV
jgi:hypothetical protein